MNKRSLHNKTKPVNDNKDNKDSTTWFLRSFLGKVR